MSRPKEGPSGFLDVRIQPGAREDRVIGRVDGRLKIRINAPAREGEANGALLRFLAGRLGVPQSRLKIVRGNRSRLKRILIDGMTPLDAERAQEKLLKEEGCGTTIDEGGL